MKGEDITIEQAIKDIKENVQPFAGGISIEMAIKALEEIEEYRVKEFQCHLAQQEGISIGYAKAIDEFAERISLEISESIIWDMLATMNKNGSLSDTSDKIVDYVIDTSKKIAEEMRGAE